MLKWIEVDLSAVERNLEAVRGLLAPGVRILGVVKADAYGHGAAAVGRLLASRGVDALGVLTVEEGLELKQAGIKADVWVLSPPLPEQAEEAVRQGLKVTVDNGALVEALAARAAKQRRAVGVHVDLDFGLGRWGLAPRELKNFHKVLGRHPKLKLEGISTHLDYVPGKNAVEAEEKLRAFARLCKGAPGKFERHAANSAILLDFPHWQLDRVRVGNLLYGINPTGSAVSLANPWQMYARIISARTVAKGRPIGYGSEYLAPRRMTVATLPVGYADGLTMEPSERLIRLGGAKPYWGLLRGHPVPFVGRCGISHVLVDASKVPAVRAGEAVALPVRRTAASARLPRVYKINAPGPRPAAEEAGPPAPLLP